MKAHELNLMASKDRKRVGRGIGSGYGKTAGRGTKGQNARTGGGVRIGFAGGQNPLAKLLPKKRGFRAINPVTYQVVNLSDLEANFKDGATVDVAVLVKAGQVKRADVRVKLLARGELKKKLALKVNAASATAKAAVEKAGGSVELVELPKAPSKKATRPQAEKPAARKTGAKTAS
jgi:large subunit ribosomal protein L15